MEQLIIRMASETLGLRPVISDQSVGNVLRRNGLPPASERKCTTPWSVFIRTHLALLAGTDFFTAEVLTLRGLTALSRRTHSPRLPLPQPQPKITLDRATPSIEGTSRKPRGHIVDGGKL